MKEAKTDKELIELIRDYIERETNGDLPGSAWFTVTSVGCEQPGEWRVAHSSDTAGLQDALTKAEADLAQLYDLKPSANSID